MHSQNALIRSMAFYDSDANDAMAGIQLGLQAVSLAQDSGLLPVALHTIGNAAMHIFMTGQLHQIEKLTKQAMLLGKQPGGTCVT